ncbi:MAG: methyltransferase [Betaproteobacteria bacterium HGW-Betaproteobacteria-8]|nr:MAG: methyltransferase [Betaproteobacteria bacterium HGW-Betaproteobacteria-8]
MNDAAHAVWTEDGKTQLALWRSENATKVPQRIVVADDRLTADAAYRYACEGTAMLWRGDYQNARQLLQAMARRIDKKPARKPPATLLEAFHLYRQAQLQRARILGMLLIPLDAQYTIPLRRAPDVKPACLEAYGETGEDSLVSLRELLGVIGAHEWRRNGVEIPALGAKIHPYYGVYSPVRGEYLELVAQVPLGNRQRAFDIGTGTGVIAALLAKRGISHVIATDMDERAIACAQENIRRLGLQKQVEVIKTDLFPPGKAELIVCNPPWLPASANSRLDHAIYDPDSHMLKGFLNGLAEHLETGGEGWLILSDLAEHLGLRSRQQLLQMFADAGLHVIEKLDIKPRHPKSADQSDPLHAARQAELTSLWVLSI